MQKRFTVIDEAFTCAVCGREVSALGYTSRDHCNSCLCSLHVDNFPGDRSADCGGVLRPIGLEITGKAKKIIYKCDKCGVRKKNIVAEDDDGARIIDLSTKPM